MQPTEQDRTGGGQDDAVTAVNVDLSNCDKELIHMPGLIQPHGVMLVLRPADLVILQASENTAALFGVPAAALFVKGLAALLGAGPAAAISAEIAHAGDRLDSGPLLLLSHVTSAPGGDCFHAIAHRAGDVLILEFERIETSQPHHAKVYSKVTGCIALLQSTTGLQDFLDLAVTQIRLFSGFDRVMAYRFAEDGSGMVVAEARRDDLNAYLGQHFPASDIPAPARRLFALTWLRHLPDVDYKPVRMLPEAGHQTDMSRAILRHVSVMYSSYLKNMRVRATMVMPLMKGGRLWGLISCMHHASPLHVPFETRMATELLAHMVSLLMAEQEDRETADYRLRMNEAIAVLVRQMAQEHVYHRGLHAREFGLLGWLDAAGAAFATDDGVILRGTTPTEMEVSGLAAWLRGRDDPAPVVAIDRLPQVYPPAEAFKATASGLLAIRPMRNGPDFVMWFRPELVQTAHWAGDPRKPVQVDVVDGEARLSPRVSFELWKETVRGRSAPWLACEIEAARMLRQAIAEVVLGRLNEELRRSNTELDNFAYVASHDLKEPLRGIHNFAHFLQRSADAKLTDEERGRIQTIIRLTQRMDDLTDALLKYSRVGRIDFSFEPVDMDELVRQTLDVLETRIAETSTTVRIPRCLPTVWGDRVRLAEVFSNLITNAIKYNDRPAGERWVEIGWRGEGAERAFYVRDNGIGIEAEYLERVFQIFRRLHARNEYGGGSGAGLTIARRTVERHGGRMWAESAGTGKGTTFLFTLGAAPSQAQPS